MILTAQPATLLGTVMMFTQNSTTVLTTHSTFTQIFARKVIKQGGCVAMAIFASKPNKSLEMGRRKGRNADLYPIVFAQASSTTDQANAV